MVDFKKAVVDRVLPIHDRVHIDIDGIRIELPLPTDKNERLAVMQAIRSAKWCVRSPEENWHPYGEDGSGRLQES